MAKQRYTSLTRTTFTADLNPFFAKAPATFSVAMVGKLKYSAMCDEDIEHRREVETSTTIVTYTFMTNLHAQIYIDGELKIDKPQQGEIGSSLNIEDNEYQFTIEVPTSNKMYDIGIFLSNEAVVVQRPANDFFFEMYAETWMTERREVLPNEIFFMDKVDDTQPLVDDERENPRSTAVVPASASG